MYQINEPIENYKSCVKVLWDNFYSKLPDGEHDFEAIRRLVWETLIVKFLYDTNEDIAVGQIVVRGKTVRSKVLKPDSSANERSISWHPDARIISGQLFIFEDFFDFRQIGDRHALDYVQCRTDSSPAEQLLIPTQDVDFYYRERPASSCGAESSASTDERR